MSRDELRARPCAAILVVRAAAESPEAARSTQNDGQQVAEQGRRAQLRNYELVLMLDADVDEERVGAVMDRVRTLMGEGGEVVDEDTWGRKKLAYKIGNRSEANYHLAHLTTRPPTPIINMFRRKSRPQ